MMPPTQLPTTDTPEGDLSRLTSISRADLKKWREKMTAGVDWTGGDGRPIVITAAGLERLQALLAEREASEAAEAIAGAGEALQAGTAYVELVVLRVGSPRVLLARKKEAGPDDPPLRVMVKSSTHFLPGMALERCQPSGRFPTLYFYHGRLPRRRGRF